jgi:hypothetical protein
MFRRCPISAKTKSSRTSSAHEFGHMGFGTHSRRVWPYLPRNRDAFPPLTRKCPLTNSTTILRFHSFRNIGKFGPVDAAAKSPIRCRTSAFNRDRDLETLGATKIAYDRTALHPLLRSLSLQGDCDWLPATNASSWSPSRLLTGPDAATSVSKPPIITFGGRIGGVTGNCF